MEPAHVRRRRSLPAPHDRHAGGDLGRRLPVARRARTEVARVIGDHDSDRAVGAGHRLRRGRHRRGAGGDAWRGLCLRHRRGRPGADPRPRPGGARMGWRDRIGLIKVAPGPLPFPPGSFDVVFSKDSIVHIPDKHALMAEVFRVLKPGGRFLASDWLIGTEGAPSALMADYIAAEGLDFGMATPARYLRGDGGRRGLSRRRPPRATCGIANRRGPSWTGCAARWGRRRRRSWGRISSIRTSASGRG